MRLSVCNFELQKSLYTGPRQWSNIFQISISVLSSRAMLIWWKTLQWSIRILFKSSRNETWNDWLSHKKVRDFSVELNSILSPGRGGLAYERGGDDMIVVSLTGVILWFGVTYCRAKRHYIKLWRSRLGFQVINLQKKNEANIQPSWPNKLGQ